MKIRIYYEDTDCGKVVYYANYLRFMERSRTEYLREKGLDLEEYHKSNILFAVIEANIKYRKPARYNDLIDVVSEIKSKSSVKITFTTDITRNGELLVRGDVTLACISANGKVRRIPEEFLNAVSD